MLIIGHRGFPAAKKENTLESFQAALTCGVDGIELDVQITTDQKLAIYHDFEIYNNNQSHAIINLSFREIQRLCPGFSIPTLNEVCKMFIQNKILNIEIKSQQIQNYQIIKEILATVSLYHLENNIILSSFNPFVLLEVRRQNPNIKIGLLWTGNNSEGWFVTHKSSKQLKPYSFHANINFITQNLAERITAQGMKLFLYTVNTKAEFQKAQTLHAYAIFTDYPDKFTARS